MKRPRKDDGDEVNQALPCEKKLQIGEGSSRRNNEAEASQDQIVPTSPILPYFEKEEVEDQNVSQDAQMRTDPEAEEFDIDDEEALISQDPAIKDEPFEGEVEVQSGSQNLEVRADAEAGEFNIDDEEAPISQDPAIKKEPFEEEVEVQSGSQNLEGRADAEAGEFNIDDEEAPISQDPAIKNEPFEEHEVEVQSRYQNLQVRTGAEAGEINMEGEEASMSQDPAIKKEPSEKVRTEAAVREIKVEHEEDLWSPIRVPFAEAAEVQRGLQDLQVGTDTAAGDANTDKAASTTSSTGESSDPQIMEQQVGLQPVLSSSDLANQSGNVDESQPSPDQQTLLRQMNPETGADAAAPPN